MWWEFVFVTADNFRIAEPKQVEKSDTGLLARFILCKLIYVKLTQQKTGLSLEEMKVKAMDQSKWRHVVGTVDPLAPGLVR